MFEIVEDAEVKLCKDCKFYNADSPQCRALGNSLPDYVNGSATRYHWEFANACRTSTRYCGPSASWFEPK